MRSVRARVVRLLAAAALLIAGCGRPAPPPPPRFRDVSREVGFQFVHTNGASGRKYFIETMGSGVAFLDYDNDGFLDLLCVNGASLPGTHSRHPTLALYRNVGGRRFEDVTAAAGLDRSFYGMGCCVGDYDNDGWEDIYVSAVLGPGHLFHNRGGKFEDVTERAGVGNTAKWGTSCCWVDYDRDGRLDLFIANYVRYRSLADDIPCYVRPDRRSYCIPPAYEGSASALYHNEGGGKFRDVTREAGVYDATMKALGVAVCDFDQDGWPDLFVANDTVPNRLFHNEHGRFTEVGAAAGIAFSDTGTPRAGMGIDVGQWREDGSLAVAVTNFTRESIGLFAQEQSHAAVFRDMAMTAGVAAPSKPYLGFGILFLDYDNDCLPDLLAVNGHVRDDAAELETGQSYAQPALLFHNEGEGRFRDVSALAGAPITEPRVARGLAAGDFDNDGGLDLLVSENHGRARLWHNETVSRGHWLLVRLEGTRSNRDGLGARIELEARGKKQVAWACSGSSYLSASDRRVHFGLGNARQVEKLTVVWPSGATDVLQRVAADRVLTVREGESHGR